MTKKTLFAFSLLCAALPAAFPLPAQGGEDPGAPPPERILIVGDSLMVLTARSVGVLLDRRSGIEHETFTSIGSGLARLDIFDWMAKLDEMTERFRPDLTLAWFGANDRQPMSVDGEIVATGTEAWEREYAQRLGMAMDKLTAPDGARVLWLELPDMRDAREQDHAMRVNRIAQEEAGQRPAVSLFPTRPLLSRRVGTYSPYVFSPEGQIIHIRAADGGHLTPTGAERMAEALILHLYPPPSPTR